MLNIRKKKKNINIFNYPNNDLVHLSDVKIEKIENNREQLNKVEPDSIDKVNPKQNIIIINEKNIRQDNKQKNNDDIIIKKEDFELNSLNYEEAILLDHRNYCQYYFSLLKYNHPILFSFGPYNDYNSRIIKIFLFFYFLFFDLAINALFFTDDTMHKIYQDKGKFNIFYQIPQILYSTIISKIINSLIRNFALIQDDILALKQEKEIKKELELKHKNFLRRLKIKFILFFIISFIFLAFISYYITCFCGIYINTQMHLFKDALISLITSLIIPFGLCLFPGILRIIALKGVKPTRKFLYELSMYVEKWFS